MTPYDPKQIEKKWQEKWEKEKLYEAKEEPGKKKSYVLDMFPYPSGEGLHVGHPKGYIATDVYSRYKRMNGFNILHPMGWDAFGLPAENFAIKNKVHPRTAVERNIKRFKEQLSILGFNYDWSREINTTDPEYYKWTQWIFLKLYEKGLAFESHEPINWCPSCQTGLANEDLEDGKCERCGSAVEKRPMRQWVLKITDYADRLLADLGTLNWPESIKESQRNWIGRSEGAELEFNLDFKKNPADNERRGHDGKPAHISVFTTRPDTLFGATYLVLAPEHLWVTLATDDNHDVLLNKDEVKAYIQSIKNKTEIERTAEGKEKTGVELKGVTAINPATGEEIPMWIADYVLAQYGTGAIMAVPAHDERDFAFAQKFGLPIKEVIEPETGEALPNEEFRRSIVAIVEDPKTGKILCLDWTEKYGGILFIGGGLEGNEDPAEAARREIAEETGYTNVKLVRTSGKTHHHYFAFSKNAARNTEVTGLHFQLIDDAKAELKLEDNEKERFTVLWLDKNEAEQKVHDENHALFFQKFIRNRPYTGKGVLVNSGKFDGMKSDEAKTPVTEFAGGKLKVTYKLRDWVFSRQRYWGEPIPMIHCEKCGVVPVPEKDLPVRLPDVEHYEPSGTGESPLANISEWVNVSCPKCEGKAKRETNTMPQWAGSSWYYLRYMDPHNDSALVGKDKEKYWAPVDMYVGGAEHATRHLIYARFWHKFLFDIGVASTREPFARLQNVGLILAEDGRKMSKRYGNTINPDDVVAQFGADTLRVYEMFMGPFAQLISWSTDNMIGPRRFIERIWKLKEKVGEASADAKIESLLHKTVKKVGEDIEGFAFNTAISSMMILANELEKDGKVPQEHYEALLKLISPFAPHVAEELWQSLGHSSSIHLEPWPAYDESKLRESVVRIVVQVNGKVRGSFEAAPETAEEEAKAEAQKLPDVKKWLDGQQISKVIFVKGKLVSFVTAKVPNGD